jgi:hypothetical protein
MEGWIATLRRRRGATVTIRAYGVLAGILDDAVKARRLRVNPARGVENLPRKSAKRHVYLSVEDVGRLAAEAGQHRVLVLTLAYTGIRWGEAVALRVRDVQFLRRRLSVHVNAVQLGVDHAVGETKSRKDRSVPVPQFVLDELAVQCEGRSLDDLVFGDGTNYLPRPKQARAVAVAEGFEPSDGGYPSHAFEACSLGRSDTPPCGSLPNADGLKPIAAWRRTPPAAPRTPRPALPHALPADASAAGHGPRPTASRRLPSWAPTPRKPAAPPAPSPTHRRTSCTVRR